MTDRAAIYAAIDRERAYQDRKRPRTERLSLPGYLLVMRAELDEAIESWVRGDGGIVPDALREVLQVVAVGVAALEAHGVVERPAVVFSLAGVEVSS